MKISHKLTLMAIVAVVVTLVVGGNGLYVANTLENALDTVHTNGVGGVRSLNRLKIHQQTLSLAIYRHMTVNKPEQKAEFEKVTEDARQSFEKDMTAYEGFTNSVRGKELIKETRTLFADYLAVIPTILERSRAGDLQGAMNASAAAGLAVRKLTANLDEMISNNVKNTERRVEENHVMAKRGFNQAVATIFGAVIVMAVFSFTLIRGIRRSLAAMQTAVEQIEGNLDFTVQAKILGKDEVAEVSTSLNRLIQTMRGNLKTIADGAKSVASSASQMTTTSTQVSTAAQQQSESASDMAATVEELTVSINHVGERAQEANRISRESGDMAITGEAVITRTVNDIQEVASTVNEAAERIHGLEKHSQEISNVVAVIKEVADQTNLLALNAAIEAARAGEQGRGFAVVADEVRKLAERTAISTTEISKTITTMRASAGEAVACMEGVVGKVSKGVESAQQANDAIRSIEEGSRVAVGMVEEIATAIREQATAMNNIAEQVEHIAQMSEESSAAAGHSADTAQNLDQVANNLQQIVNTYRL